MSKIAVPLIDGKFSSHFGGADAFGLFEVDQAARTILKMEVVPAPPHERGAFPTWLHENGATVILAGGMGPRAVQMFEQFGIQVLAGVGGEDPRAVVKAFLAGDLVSTGETCGGGHLHACGDHGHEGG